MLIIHMYIYLYIHNIKLIKMQNLSQLVSAVGCPQEKHVCFQWRNKVTNLMPGVRHCDVVFLMSLLHMTFRETDALEMQKC